MRAIATSIMSIALVMGYPALAGKKDKEIAAWKSTLPAADADYGAYPDNYEQLIKEYLARSLKDPDSVRYTDFTKPRKEHAIENAGLKQAIYGYSSCVLVNAKNSYGGYTGNHQYWFFIQNGKIVRSSDTTTGLKIIYLGRPINCEDGP